MCGFRISPGPALIPRGKGGGVGRYGPRPIPVFWPQTPPRGGGGDRNRGSQCGQRLSHRLPDRDHLYPFRYFSAVNFETPRPTLFHTLRVMTPRLLCDAGFGGSLGSVTGAWGAGGGAVFSVPSRAGLNAIRMPQVQGKPLDAACENWLGNRAVPSQDACPVWSQPLLSGLQCALLLDVRPRVDCVPGARLFYAAVTCAWVSVQLSWVGPQTQA